MYAMLLSNHLELSHAGYLIALDSYSTNVEAAQSVCSISLQ